MKTVREQAKAFGHEVCGTLNRAKDDVFTKNGEVIRNKTYVDEEGTNYAVNWKGELVYIAGEDFVI